MFFQQDLSGKNVLSVGSVRKECSFSRVCEVKMFFQLDLSGKNVLSKGYVR